MKLLMFSLLALAANAQTLSVTGPATANPDATVPITITLASPVEIAGIEWMLSAPSSTGFGMPFGTQSEPISATITDAGVQCSSDVTLCHTVEPRTSGTVATVNLKIPPVTPTGPITFSLAGIRAVDAEGKPVPVNETATFTFSVVEIGSPVPKPPAPPTGLTITLQ